MRIVRKENIKLFFDSLRNKGVKSTAKKVLQGITTAISAPKEFRGIPLALHIETTTLCNLNCEYCALRREKADQNATMELQRFELLRPYFKYVHSIELSGAAEPLMNKRITDFTRIRNSNYAGGTAGSNCAETS